MAEPAGMQQANLSKLRIERDEDEGSGWLRYVLLLLLLVALGVGGWFAWDRFLKPAPEVKVARVTSPAAAAASKELDASGYLIPQRRAEVATKVAGIVGKVHVDEGATVKEGDPLAELVSDVEKAQLEEAQVAVREAEGMKKESDKALVEADVKVWETERDVARWRALFEKEAAHQAEMDRAEAAWRAAVARRDAAKTAVDVAVTRQEAAANRVKQAKIRLEETIIRSPIAGRVTSRKVHPGEAASPAGIVTGTRGGALFTVADFASLEAEVDVNESRLSELREKHPARVAVDAVPGKRYRGELRQIVPTADRQRAVVKVRVKVLDPDAALLPEMGVRVTFVAEEKSVSAEPELPRIPEKAIYESDGKTYAWVVSGDKVARREIEVGKRKDGVAEVKKGLSGGESVVIENSVPLSEGLRVKAGE